MLTATCQPEMEKGGGSKGVACANFWVFHVILKSFFDLYVYNLSHFCSSMHDFDHFLYIFCVLIFQAQSFASAILSAFSISGANDSVGI